jgi:site-specific DNA-methyltransferase (adenine-specific)
MSINPALFSSVKEDWATPWDFFEEQAAKYGPFDLDVCAEAHNAKCPDYLTPEQNALVLPWHGVCWMNPPYGRGIHLWIDKAWLEVREGRARRVVCLLPARTDTSYWHRVIFPHASQIDFIKGRIKFEGAKAGAPFPSAVVVFDKAFN